MENKILTAEEIAINYAKNSAHDYANTRYFEPHEWVLEAMIEFAKLHVQEALIEAIEKLQPSEDNLELVNSILNCYSDSNIK